MASLSPVIPWEKRLVVAGARSAGFRPPNRAVSSGSGNTGAAQQHQVSITGTGELIPCELLPIDPLYHVQLIEPCTFGDYFNNYQSCDEVSLIKACYFDGKNCLLPRSLMIAGIMYLVIHEAESGEIKKVLMVDVCRRGSVDLIADTNTLLQMAINKGQQCLTKDKMNFNHNTAKNFQASVFCVMPTNKIDHYGLGCYQRAFLKKGIALGQTEYSRRPVSMSREEQGLKWHDLSSLHFPVLQRGFLHSFDFSGDVTACADLARAYQLSVRQPHQMLLEAQSICRRSNIPPEIIRSGSLYAFATDENTIVSAMQMGFNKPNHNFRQWNSHEMALALVGQRRRQLENQRLLPPDLNWSLMFFSDFDLHLHGSRPSYLFNSVGVSASIEREQPLPCGLNYDGILSLAGNKILSSPWSPVAKEATKLPFHSLKPGSRV